jgi:receptor protein-tyrosine kinase
MKRDVHSKHLVTSGKQSIGHILLASGRISPETLAEILVYQKRHNTPFGEAAVALSAVSQEDIDFALSQQFDYSYLSQQDQSVSSQLVTAFKPFSRVGENMRAIRSQLLLRWFNNDPLHKALAIVSAAPGEGRSFMAANLAVVFAQQGSKTLLIDADMRSKPENSIQALFKLERTAGLSGVLSGRAGTEAMQLVPGLPMLGVLAAGAVPPNPQELLSRPMFAKLMRGAINTFDVVLIDTPNGGAFSDAELIAARAGAALMVAKVNHTLVPEATAFARRLQDGGVNLVGSVLNDA